MDQERHDEPISKSDLNGPLRAIMAAVAKVYPDVELISTEELDGLLKELNEKEEGVVDPGSNIVLLDIRERPEYEESHLSGAEFIDYTWPWSKQFNHAVEIIKKKVEERKKKDESMKVYAYCAVGMRASVFLDGLKRRLQKMKTRDGSSVDPEDMRASGDDTLPYSSLELKVVQGSIYKWAYERRPLVDMEGHETPVVHRYSSLWGKIFLHKEFRNTGLCRLIY